VTETPAADSPDAKARAPRWRFGDCVLDGRTLELTVRGQLVKLEPKPLDMLMFLLRHPDEVLTKDELLEGLWPGRILSESVLTKCVAKLRQGLGDEAQSVIKTVHGFGYRLIAPVTVEHDAAPLAASTELRAGLSAGEHPPQRPLWVLREAIGAGGGGEVWLAEHAKTGERRVFKFATDAAGLSALKREVTLFRLLQATYGPRDDLLRLLDWNFEALPYFVEAEHVAGGSLLQWSERRGGLAAVPIAQRIALAIQLAEVLAAAHAAGVLHKDLKPANVLVAGTDAEPRLKLGDFGSGRVLDLARLERLEITRLGFTAMPADDEAGTTPLYLAPELLAGQQPTVQSDLYALGVMLYQLLVGDWRRPLAPGWERTLDDELLREDVAVAAAGDPQRRLTNAAELARRLRELDERRSQRAHQRELEAEAATLHAALERSRHRRKLQRAIAAVLALGLGLSSWGFWNARQAQHRAEAAAAEARAAVSFLGEDVLAATDPFGGGRPTLSIKGLLDEAAPRLATRLADYPAMRAEMGLAMGRAYEGLGDWPKARERLEVALAEAEDAHGKESELALTIAEKLGSLALLQSRYDDSEALYRRVFEARRKQFGELDARTLSVRDGLAWLQYERGRYPQSAALYEQLVEDFRQSGELDQAGLTSAQWSLADCYLELNRTAEAEALMREVVATTSRLQGAKHPRALWQRTTLGDALMIQGRWDEAAVLFDEAYEGLAATVGETHPYTLTALHYRGQLMLERGDPVAALPLLRRAYENRVLAHGVDHVWARYSANRVGEALVQLGLANEALPLLERAHEQSMKAQGPEHPNVLLIQRTLADALIALGQYERADALLVEGLAHAQRVLPENNLRIGYYFESLGHLRALQKRHDDAQAQYEAARALYAKASGPTHPQTLKLTALAQR
jgi:DNA-binding winged helix-turn-helix (wHTH) protein/tetratricopeptide (TPR) repeat protein